MKILMTLTIVLLLSGCAHAGEGAYGIIERPDGTRNPHIEQEGPQNNSVGNGRAYEFTERKALECAKVLPYSAENQLGETFLDAKSGWVVTQYDTNGNGRRDVMTLSAPGTFYPRMYIFDIDHDDLPDLTLIDRAMDGTCDGLKLMWKRGEENLPGIPGTRNYDPSADHDRLKKSDA